MCRPSKPHNSAGGTSFREAGPWAHVSLHARSLQSLKLQRLAEKEQVRKIKSIKVDWISDISNKYPFSLTQNLVNAKARKHFQTLVWNPSMMCLVWTDAESNIIDLDPDDLPGLGFGSCLCPFCPLVSEFDASWLFGTGTGKGKRKRKGWCLVRRLVWVWVQILEGGGCLVSLVSWWTVGQGLVFVVQSLA